MEGSSPGALGGGRGSKLAERARMLVAECRRGVLSTLIEGDGFPYASLVDLLPLADGDLAMFLSALAEHRRYLEADGRASVLVAPSIMEPHALALPRVTLVGRAQPVEDRESLAARYVERHPAAEMYIGFPDFKFFRLRVARARYIAGFGEMGWIRGGDYRAAG